jgi:hypothetical protein
MSTSEVRRPTYETNITIIVIVMVLEYSSGIIRAKVQ